MRMPRTIARTLAVCILLGAAFAAAAPVSAGGEVIGRNILGLAVDYQGDPVRLAEASLIYGDSVADITVSHGEARFRASIFQHAIGGLYLTELSEKGGAWDTRAVNMADAGGLSHPCTAAKTPWESLLIGESGLVDAKRPQAFVEAFSPYYKGKGDMVRPYSYGWPAELVILSSAGEAKVIRDYALGRVFASDIVMMPDGKTVYMIDRGHSDNLYLFIARRAGSLSEGTLYTVGREKGRLAYHELGSTSALKLRFKLRRADFDGIFASAPPEGTACPDQFRYTQTGYGEECLKLQRRNSRYAGLFEPIRFAAYNGFSHFAKDVVGFEYEKTSKTMRFKTESGNAFDMPLAEDKKLGSNYIIRGAYDE